MENERCSHTNWESTGGSCDEGCCDEYKCKDCGLIFYEEAAD